MPTYDCECLECKNRFEAFQKMSDPLLKECPKCRGSVRRLPGTGAGLIFKGSGFYVTDYKNKNTSSSETNKSNDKCSGCSDSACPQAQN